MANVSKCKVVSGFSGSAGQFRYLSHNLHNILEKKFEKENWTDKSGVILYFSSQQIIKRSKPTALVSHCQRRWFSKTVF